MQAVLIDLAIYMGRDGEFEARWISNGAKQCQAQDQGKKVEVLLP